MYVRPVGEELFHAVRRTERQTDMTTLTVAFRHLQTRLTTATIRKYSKPTECFAKCGLSFDGKIYTVPTKWNIYIYIYIYFKTYRFLMSPLPFIVA